MGATGSMDDLLQSALEDTFYSCDMDVLKLCGYKVEALDPTFMIEYTPNRTS